MEFNGKKTKDEIPSTEQHKFAPCEFVIEHKLGAGVFGEVFLATSESTGEEVALKKISKRNPKFDVHMVSREITAGQSLRNEGIVEYKSHFETVNNVYLVYELISGFDLCSFMTERDYEPVNEKEAKKIMEQVVRALVYCHEQGIAHRDIKLDNILITAEGKTKVVDFGLSTSKMAKTDRCKDYVGSPEYAAPEIMARSPYNPFKSDVFSCGVVMYGLLFGEFPFSTADRWDKVAAGDHPTIRWADKTPISTEAKDLIQKMLEVSPEKRLAMHEILQHSWFGTLESIAASLESCHLIAEEVKAVKKPASIHIF